MNCIVSFRLAQRGANPVISCDQSCAASQDPHSKRQDMDPGRQMWHCIVILSLDQELKNRSSAMRSGDTYILHRPPQPLACSSATMLFLIEQDALEVGVHTPGRSSQPVLKIVSCISLDQLLPRLDRLYRRRERRSGREQGHLAQHGPEMARAQRTDDDRYLRRCRWGGRAEH
jgi:hypothetical protein